MDDFTDKDLLEFEKTLQKDLIERRYPENSTDVEEDLKTLKETLEEEGYEIRGGGASPIEGLFYLSFIRKVSDSIRYEIHAVYEKEGLWSMVGKVGTGFLTFATEMRIRRDAILVAIDRGREHIKSHQDNRLRSHFGGSPQAPSAGAPTSECGSED